MNVNIPIAMAPSGALVPSQGGPGMATVSYKQDVGQPKTAIIAFSGANQAVVTFNEYNQAVNFTMLQPGATMQDMQSVQNIINHISTQHTVH